MRYLPHTPEDIDEMMKTVGVDSLDDLFKTIPADCRCDCEPNLPEALTEWELNDHIDTLCSSMAVSPEYKVFMGAGSYEHHIPVTVKHLLGRSEFVTSYTPYQPEMSQGTLQAIFEYQTLTARLLGMEVANASQYDGASALAEALLMAIRISRRKKVAVSRLIHPNYRRVIKTYFAPTDYEIIELPFLPDGTTDPTPLEGLDDLAAVAVQSPNFFGCIEDLQTIGDRARQEKALMVAGFSEPLAFGMMKNPGSQGADIAAGEGQGLAEPCNHQCFFLPGLVPNSLKVFNTAEKIGRLNRHRCQIIQALKGRRICGAVRQIGKFCNLIVGGGEIGFNHPAVIRMDEARNRHSFPS